MQVHKEQINNSKKIKSQEDNNFELTPKMIKEVKNALDEAKNGKLISDNHFEKHFCK